MYIPSYRYSFGLVYVDILIASQAQIFLSTRPNLSDRNVNKINDSVLHLISIHDFTFFSSLF